ncbi:MAG TPA: transporter substrate-binding domain-containing protein [Rhodocyclaceae bacterium]|nr:transporter substrate-binding domain-containing protein [Rhodocyclaceae bacterium]
MKFSYTLRSLALIAALSTLATPASAAPLEVGMLNFPPYYLLENESKPVGGYWFDFLKVLMARAGVDYAFKGYPPKRLYQNVAEGTTSIWMGVKDVPDYAGKVLVSPKQISEINMELYAMGASAAIPKSIDELKGKSLITIRGYSYGGMVTALNDPKNGIKIEVANTHEAAFQMLQAGRGEYLLDYIEPASETLAKLSFPPVSKYSIKVLPIYIMVSKSLPNAQDLMDKLMKAHDEIGKENKLKAEKKFKQPA